MFGGIFSIDRMRQCPECKRVYYDETLNYCLEDGSTLVYGPATHESPTAVVTSEAAVGEAPTRTFQPSYTAGERIPSGPVSTRSSIFAVVFGVVLITALGLGSYWYYRESSTKQINSIAVMPFINETGN